MEIIGISAKENMMLLLLLMGYLSSDAQTRIPVTTTIRTPQGNVSYTSYTYVPGQSYNNYNLAHVSTRHKFTIELKSDSTINASTKLRIDDQHHRYLKIKVNKMQRIIKPSDTKSIFRMTNDGRKIVGVPADSCWLFKVGKGKISLYSFLAEDNLENVVAIQEEGNSIVKLDRHNLLAIVGNDERLRKLVEKEKFLRAIELYNEGKKN